MESQRNHGMLFGDHGSMNGEQTKSSFGVVYCALKGRQLSVNKGTSHITKHLRNIHQKLDSKLAKLPTIKASPITKKTSSNQSTLFSHRQLDRKKVIELVVKWTIRTQQPFIAVESQDFRALLTYFNPIGSNLLPKTGDTIRSHAASTKLAKKP
jgi:hypothetical protein